MISKKTVFVIRAKASYYSGLPIGKTFLKLLYILFILLVNIWAQNDPCLDQRYVNLKNVPFDSMSDREYEYFMQKEKYCNESSLGLKNNVITPIALCTLIVTYKKNHYKFSSTFPHKLNINFTKVYLNNISYKMPLILVQPGKYKLSLFSDSEIEAGRSYLSFTNSVISPSNTYKQMLLATKTIHLKEGERKKIHFEFKCNPGPNNRCGGDEWFIEIKIYDL